eukprot:7800212-Pyramimonas_sp.AAC.1
MDVAVVVLARVAAVGTSSSAGGGSELPSVNSPNSTERSANATRGGAASSDSASPSAPPSALAGHWSSGGETPGKRRRASGGAEGTGSGIVQDTPCLLYTSDAADDTPCVDL